jgi:hypothetical protein
MELILESGFRSKKHIRSTLEIWCEINQIPLENVVLIGSGALLFHGLADVSNDIDIVLPASYREQYDDLVADIATTVAKIDLRISGKYERTTVEIDGINVSTIPELWYEYRANRRSKDVTKLVKLNTHPEVPQVVDMRHLAAARDDRAATRDIF